MIFEIETFLISVIIVTVIASIAGEQFQIMIATIAELFFRDCSNRSDHNNGNLALNRLMCVIIVLIVWYPIQEEKGQYSLMRVHVVCKTSH